MSLERYLVNPFDRPGVSVTELLAFATDHLQRMIANNPGGILNERIAATQAALDGLMGSKTEDQTQLGLRRARKKVLRDFRRKLAGEITRLHGAVVAQFGPRTPEVLACFPQGRLALARCADDALERHLWTLAEALTAQSGVLGAGPQEAAEGLLARWRPVHQASESSTAAKAAAEERGRQARRGLQLELFRNLLTLALMFPRQPESLKLYMQESWLQDRPRRKTAGQGGDEQPEQG